MIEIERRVRVERPIEDLTGLLGARPSDWLLPFLRIASQAGDDAGWRAAEKRGESAGDRSVSVEIADASLADDSGLDEVSFPIWWETAGYSWLARRFSGVIRMSRVSDQTTEIVIAGRYDSLRGAERAGNASAQALVESLLRNLRIAVEEQARSALWAASGGP